MRLTAELVNNSLSYLNPLKERELELRGHKIPTIENLGVAGPQDAIDFTDNDITSLSNFPLSPRLNTLLCARNRVQGVDKRIAEQLPNLMTLVLSSNLVKELGDLEGLSGSLPPLCCLAHIITSVPGLSKIREIERKQAIDLFGTVEQPSELAAKIKGVKSKTFSVSDRVSSGGASVGGKGIRVQLTESERKRVQEMAKNAKTFAEIAKIEKDLAEGRIPAGAADADRMVP